MHRLVAVVAACFLFGAPSFADQTPNELVEEAAGEMLAALDSRRSELESDKAALYELADEILLPKFDTVYAARLTLGKHWRNANKEQRKRFVDAFYQSLLNTYAEGLLEFTSDSLKVMPFRGDLEGDRATVRTEVRLQDGTTVPVNYSLRRRDDGWRVWDVTIEGISYVKNYRSDFNSEIQANGLDALIQRLESEQRRTAS